jgi:hypothetical protein
VIARRFVEQCETQVALGRGINWSPATWVGPVETQTHAQTHVGMGVGTGTSTLICSTAQQHCNTLICVDFTDRPPQRCAAFTRKVAKRWASLQPCGTTGWHAAHVHIALTSLARNAPDTRYQLRPSAGEAPDRGEGSVGWRHADWHEKK